MPHCNYPNKLTDREIINLFNSLTPKYYLCEESWVILNRKREPIRIYKGGKNGDYKCVTLYDNKKMKFIPLAKLIWMIKTNRVVPKGFEIHHRNKDPEDNRFSNLFCLYRLDHQKLHDDSSLIEEEIPF